MRMKREFFKPRDKGVYLHFTNHTVTLRGGELPFGDKEKAKLFAIINRYVIKYNIDLISVVILGNHYHMLLYSHPEKFTLEKAHRVYNEFHNNVKKPVSIDSPRVESLAGHSNNFSEFMREVQREFSCWFNATRDYEREGALWRRRFYCQLIQSEAYLWACVKYLELNPVRAGILDDPENYSYSTFGKWSYQQKHPYQNSIIIHLLPLISEKVEHENDKKGNEKERDTKAVEDLRIYMAREMDVMKNLDLVKKLRSQGKKNDVITLEKEIEQQQGEHPKLMSFFSMRNSRGLIIGSDKYLREQYQQWEILNSYESTA